MPYLHPNFPFDGHMNKIMDIFLILSYRVPIKMIVVAVIKITTTNTV